MNKDEAMQQALEQPPLPVQPEPSSECNPQDLCAGCRCKYGAQPPLPVQEPVAWLYPEGLEALQAGKCWTAYPRSHEDCNIPLYIATPPQREWVGLTVTTILNMMPSTIPADYDGELMEFARAVEVKLKELNK